MTSSREDQNGPGGPGPEGIDPPSGPDHPRAVLPDHARTTPGPRTTFRGCVRIHAGICELTVHSPRIANTVIKNAVPAAERLWDRGERCWRVQTRHLATLAHDLTKAGYSVRVIRPGQAAPTVRTRTREIRGAW